MVSRPWLCKAAHIRSLGAVTGLQSLIQAPEINPVVLCGKVASQPYSLTCSRASYLYRQHSCGLGVETLSATIGAGNGAHTPALHPIVHRQHP